jgi:hypothetical protein
MIERQPKFKPEAHAKAPSKINVGAAASLA